MQVIITPNSKKIAIMENTSAGALAKHPALSGNIGKTSILEMLRGKRKEAKGYKIVEVEKPKIANKLAVESVGTGKQRQRKPMMVYVKPTNERGISPCMKDSDFKTFLQSVYSGAKSDANGVEYSKLADSLGWSRNMIAIYSARAQKLGYVQTERQSNFVRGNAK